MQDLDRRRFVLTATAWIASLGCRAPRTVAPGAAALFDAIARGDLEAARAALDAQPRVASAVDAEGRSGFAQAWLLGHGDIADLLRERGYAPDPVERCLAGELEAIADGLTAPTRAMLHRWHPVGGDALWAAARAGQGDVWRLTSLGMLPDDAGQGGGAVHAALACPDPLAAWLTAIDLLGNGASPAGRPSLLLAALERGDARLAALLVRKGAPRDRTLESLSLSRHDAPTRAALAAALGGTPTDHRSSRLAYDASGAPWRAPDLAALDPAVVQRAVGLSHGNLDGVREVVGDDHRYSSSRSYQDEVAVEACAHTGRREIVHFHLERGAPLSLPTCFTLGDLDRAAELLREDPLRVNERGAHDFAVTWYPLIGRCGAAGLELLLEHGAAVDQESYGTTALHWAAMYNDADAAQLLLERGADVNAVGYKFGRRRETPLDIAQRRESPVVAALLREHGGASAA